jgi:hypothetical protein
MSKQKTHFITLLVPDPGVFITEHLRYMGAIRVFSRNHPGYLEPEVKNCFKLRVTDGLVTVECPEPGKNAPVWARMQLSRLESFGVAAIWWWRDENGRVTADLSNQTPTAMEMFTNRLVEELC